MYDLDGDERGKKEGEGTTDPVIIRKRKHKHSTAPKFCTHTIRVEIWPSNKIKLAHKGVFIILSKILTN